MSSTQRGHPQRLGLDAGHRLQRADGQLVGGAADQLGVPADRRQRGAQLVAGVGDELAHLRLGLVPGRERLLDVPEQLVERGTHLADLGGGVGVLRGHAVGEDHLAAVEGQLGPRGWRCATTRSSGRSSRRTSTSAGGRRDQQGERGDDELDDDERR